MPVQARWNGTVLAESDDTVVVEGNHYFPPESVRQDHFTKTRFHTMCPWKGIASLKNRVAFWPGTEIVDTDRGTL